MFLSFKDLASIFRQDEANEVLIAKFFLNAKTFVLWGKNKPYYTPSRERKLSPIHLESNNCK